jgi:hypothetical protein
MLFFHAARFPPDPTPTPRVGNRATARRPVLLAVCSWRLVIVRLRWPIRPLAASVGAASDDGLSAVNSH